MRNLYYLFVVTSLFFSCTGKQQEKNHDKTVISVIGVIGAGEILNLSDFAQSVKYIPLETNDSVLVGNIEDLVWEENHISLYDFQTRQCYLFDAKGCFKRNIGKKGLGPDEYTFIRSISFIPESNVIFLFTNEGAFLYDLNGRLTSRMSSVLVPEGYSPLTTVPITDSLYFTHLGGGKDFRYHALVWGQRDTNQIYQTIPSYLKWDTTKESRAWTVSTCKWRFQNQVRSYWEEIDTILLFHRIYLLKKLLL